MRLVATTCLTATEEGTAGTAGSRLACLTVAF
jgi:hypothetical protein